MEFLYCLNPDDNLSKNIGTEWDNWPEKEEKGKGKGKKEKYLAFPTGKTEGKGNGGKLFKFFLCRLKKGTQERYYYDLMGDDYWVKGDNQHIITYETQKDFVAVMMFFMLGVGRENFEKLQKEEIIERIEKEKWDDCGLGPNTDAEKYKRVKEWFPYNFEKKIIDYAEKTFIRNENNEKILDIGEEPLDIENNEEAKKGRKKYYILENGKKFPIYYIGNDRAKKEILKRFQKELKNRLTDGFYYFIGYQDERISVSKEKLTMANQENEKNKTIKEIIEDNMKINDQIIFTGAPGTGKTYAVIEYVKGKTYEFVQFHPSYDYTDFVEGLRPVQLEKDELSFVRLDGIFKKFCRRIVMNNLDEIKDLKDDEKKSLLNETYEYYQNNQGNDKSEKDIKKIEDFAEKFDKIETPYYFVIDEINRADLSKVLGELMFGLEESYRGIKYRFNTQYQNLPTYQLDSDGRAEMMKFDCFKNGFFIPKNLKIIGTMNDIDRSVEAFDFALRRRFIWIEIKANDIMETSLISMLGELEDGEIKTKNLAKRIEKMNTTISDYKSLGLTDAYHIGPAYFKNFDGSKSTLENIFHRKIEQLLYEYTRGRKKDLVDELIKKCKEKLLADNGGKNAG